VGVPGRAGAQRVVAVEPFAGPFAALVGEAGEIRILVLRMPVQRTEQHVAATVEDLLRAVAMVEIDVEDGDARGPPVAKCLRCDGRIVEAPVSAIDIMAVTIAARP